MATTFVLVLSFAIVLSVDGASLKAGQPPSKVSPTLQHSNCPKLYPARQLAGKRNYLQHFTPFIMCESGAAGLSMKDGLSAIAINRNYPGCSEKDLENLRQLYGTELGCGYRLRCQFDANRYPPILYTAERVTTSRTARCHSSKQCKPVTKRIDVLEKSSLGPCPKWREVLRYVIIRYSCQ